MNTYLARWSNANPRSAQEHATPSALAKQPLARQTKHALAKHPVPTDQIYHHTCTTPAPLCYSASRSLSSPAPSSNQMNTSSHSNRHIDLYLDTVFLHGNGLLPFGASCILPSISHFTRCSKRLVLQKRVHSVTGFW